MKRLFFFLAALLLAAPAFAQVAWTPVGGSARGEYAVREVTLAAGSTASNILPVNPRSLVGVSFIASTGTPSITIVGTNSPSPLADASSISPTILGAAIAPTTASGTTIANPVTGVQVRGAFASTENIRVRIWELYDFRNRGYR